MWIVTDGISQNYEISSKLFKIWLTPNNALLLSLKDHILSIKEQN